LWLLDEPFTALDTVAVGLIQQMLAEHLERGGIVVMTSHQEVALASAITRTIELGG
jgi:heme exporter protein A